MRKSTRVRKYARYRADIKKMAKADQANSRLDKQEKTIAKQKENHVEEEKVISNKQQVQQLIAGHDQYTNPAPPPTPEVSKGEKTARMIGIIVLIAMGVLLGALAIALVIKYYQ